MARAWSLLLVSGLVVVDVAVGLTTHLGRSSLVRAQQTTRWSAAVVGEVDEAVVEGGETGPTPAEEEAALMKKIPGKPKMGVYGFFGEASRTDQFVLDVLHAQKCWGEIVAFAPDVAATKKKLMSRSARYSGLLDVLKFEETSSGDFGAMLASSGVDACLAFGVEPSQVRAFLEAAEAAPACDRIVVAANGPVSDSAVLSDASKLEWTVVALDVDALVDDLPEGGPIAVDSDKADDATIARADAYRIVGEAFLMEPLTNKKIALTAGGDSAVAYLRLLRERGYTRRGELAKLLSGGLKQFEADKLAEEEKTKKEAEAKEDTEEDVEAREAEMRALFEEARREEQEKRDKEIAAAARDYLARQWNEKKYATARGLSKEEFIQIEWDVGVKEAAAILGYTAKDERLKRTPGEDEEDDDSED